MVPGNSSVWVVVHSGGLSQLVRSWSSSRALIFPGEVVLPPNVGPALLPFELVDAALERVPGAVGVGFSGRGLAEEFAEVEKMLVAGGALGKL